MLAQIVRQLPAHLLEFLGEDLLDVGLAAAATRARLGADLDLLQRCSHAKSLDRVDDIAPGDVVARADLGVGVRGEFRFLDLPAGGRRGQQHRRVLGHLPPLHGERVELGVVARVADEDAAAQLGPGLVEDELAVYPPDGIVPYEVGYVRIVWAGLVLPERRHVAPQELELGRQVRSGEGRELLEAELDPELPLGHDLGADSRHVVPRRDEAVDEVVVKSDLPDGVHTVGGRLQLLVDDDPAALADSDVGAPGELVAGLDPGANDDHLDGEIVPPVVAVPYGRDGGHAIVVRGAVLPDEGFGPRVAVNLQSHAFDHAYEGVVSTLIDLWREYEKSSSYIIREYDANNRRWETKLEEDRRRGESYLTTHEDGRELDNVRLDVHVGDGLRGLKAQESTADDGGALDVVLLDVREHVLEIFDRLSLNVGMEGLLMM